MNKERDAADALLMAAAICDRINEGLRTRDKSLDRYKRAQRVPELVDVQIDPTYNHESIVSIDDIETPYKHYQRTPRLPEIEIEPNYGREAFEEIIRELSQQMPLQPCPLANRYNVPTPDMVSDIPEDE